MRAFATDDEITPDELRAHGSLPRPSRLAAPLHVTPKKAAAAAEQLGLHTVGDLIAHLPRKHIDRREATPIGALSAFDEGDATIIGDVRSIRKRSARRRNMTFVEARVADETGSVTAMWFNQPWVEGRLPVGSRVALHGRLSPRGGFQVKEYELATGELASTGMAPDYPATEGISKAKLRELQHQHRGAERHVIEPLPARLRASERLPDKAAAMAAMHFPEDLDEQEAARRRLAFEELLVHQIALVRRKQNRDALARAQQLPPPGALTAGWIEQTLPFPLTGDQRSAMAAVDADLVTPRPMQRLLMGEVGSGKTVVALYAMLRAVEAGAQAALMAPTETLAEQHFATLNTLLPAGRLVPVALLTGSTPGKRRAEILARLASGELPLLVGTHALIEEPVAFDRLALCVVDEQHRFGVEQRRRLDRKAPEGLMPHVLHMTATPIPRTLALVGYGDLDVTALHELPAGRRPIQTFVASGERERARAYERIREELRAGRQAFVVCPLVEESEALQARAATAEYERLARTEFADFEVVLMHGQMRPREKQAAMAAFAEGGADVLVATTVIEVGIDVPNASVMLVENAERHGISQLHQLRGRIGRGPHDSLCLLFGPKESPRLRALHQHRDGFRLAEIDLELRGEGEIIGVRQSGIAQFRVARLPEDAELLERARAIAERIMSADPVLAEPEYALLDDAVRERFGEEALAPIPA